MKFLRLLMINNKQYWLSFLIPILAFGLVMAHFGIYPFGSKSILVQDMYNQYVQFYNYFYDVFYHGKSLFYSWEAGMGMNFYGVFGYYLSSFFSLIVLFFPRSHLPEAMIALILIKIGCSGLAMSIYIKKTFHTKVSSNVIFSVSYALMSYSIVYFQNIMWLDGVIFLPLILLGIEYLIKETRFGLLTLAMAVTFVSNFYISYMVGIFSFFYFLYRCFIIYNSKEIKKIAEKLLYFVMITLLAAGMAAIVLIPTYYVLSQGPNHPKLYLHFNFTFPLLELGSQMLHSVFTGLKYKGLPNVYVGLLPLLLIPLYFIKRDIPIKEKVLTGIFFSIFVLSFEIPFLNKAWHGFDKPSFFPYRYSFIFSFLMLMTAARSYLSLNKKDSLNLVKIYGVLMFLIILLQSISPSIDKENVLGNLLLLTVFFVLLCAKIRMNPIKKGWINTFIIIFVVIGLSSNALTEMKDTYKQLFTVSRKYYSTHYRYLAAFQQVQNNDPGLYRLQTNLHGSLNLPFRFRYKGIRHFSSLINLSLVQSLHDLGFTTNEKWVNKEGGTLVTNSLLGFKYMLTSQSKYGAQNFGYKKTNQFSSLNFYLNQFDLPIGFLTDGVIQSVKSGQNNPFSLQNHILNRMDKPAGNHGVQYFKRLIPYKITYNGVQVIRHNGEQKLVRKNQQSSIIYSFNLKDQKQFYMLINEITRSNFKIFVNGTSLGVYPQTYNSGILNLGAFHNKKVKVRFEMNTAQMTIKPPLFYGLDINKFGEVVHYLKKDPFIVDHWTSRTLNGHIDAKRSGTLFLSVPYDKGWSIEVDGKAVKPKKALGSFMAIDITKGKHNIKMSYISPGFYLGAAISAVSILIFVFSLFFIRRKKSKKKQ